MTTTQEFRAVFRCTIDPCPQRSRDGFYHARVEYGHTCNNKPAALSSRDTMLLTFDPKVHHVSIEQRELTPWKIAPQT